jgi:hypothetical protein
VFKFIHSFIHLFIHSFFRSSFRSFVFSFVRSFVHSFVHSFIQLRLTTIPEILPKRVLHTVPSNISFFNLQYLLFSLSSLSSKLRLLPHIAFHSTLSCVFPSVTCFRRLFLRNISPIHFAFLPVVVCRKFLSSLSLYNTS